MPNQRRSDTTTQGRRAAGARSLWRAAGMKPSQFGRPIIAVVNSFTQFVPGHVHLHKIGQAVKEVIERQGCFAAEFNTIAIDDGIAMGHDGMLYSLPSRDLIADSVEYMVNAHRADAMICIGNCDKITPGMLMAAMRLNVPAVFASGGPMEAGVLGGQALDLIDAIVMGGNPSVSEAELAKVEKAACPTCGCCSGMFTANSMNCLTEALGMALPGNGTIVATHAGAKNSLKGPPSASPKLPSDIMMTATRRCCREPLPPRPLSRTPWRSTSPWADRPTRCCTCWRSPEKRASISRFETSTPFRARVPVLCKVAPSSHYHVQDVNRAGGVMAILGELDRAGLIDASVIHVAGGTLRQTLDRCDIVRPTAVEEAFEMARSAPETDRETSNWDRKTIATRSWTSTARRAAFAM